MPYLPLPERCWLLWVEHTCGKADEDGEPEGHELHDYGGDGSRLFWLIAEMWANDPEADEPPIPERPDEPCLQVTCSGCGRFLLDGMHMVGIEDAWASLAEQGWTEDRCPLCPPPEPKNSVEVTA